MMTRIYVFLIGMLMPLTSLAVLPGYSQTSIGDVADGARNVASGVGKFFLTVCLIFGISFIIAAWFQYDNYRKKMGQVRLSVPLYLLIFGIFFLIIPIVAYLSPSSKTMTF